MTLYLPSGVSPARLRMEVAGRHFALRQKRMQAMCDDGKQVARRKEVLGLRRSLIEGRERAMELAAYAAERRHYGLPTSHNIAEEIAVKYGVTLAEMMGNARGGTLSRARAETWWVCRARLGLSYEKLGVAFGRDHTSILYGCRRHAARMAKAGWPG